MTKKKVTSTYRREFSPERSACRPSVKRSFDANFNYREYRRQVEHGHHRSPFIWDDWEYELNGEERYEEPTARRCQSSRPRVAVPSSSSSESLDSQVSECNSQQVPARADGQCQTSARSPDSASPPSTDECNCGAEGWTHEVQGQPARILSDTISKTLKKVSKRSRQRDLDLHRPASAPIDDSPFAQYGVGDDESETGCKRTHNILSHQGVYQSALDAKQRQQAGKELGRRCARGVSSKTTLHDPRFDDAMDKQTSRWQTEYGTNFRQFPVERRRRNL